MCGLLSMLCPPLPLQERENIKSSKISENDEESSCFFPSDNDEAETTSNPSLEILYSRVFLISGSSSMSSILCDINKINLHS